jgi:hypothetical protein
LLRAGRGAGKRHGEYGCNRCSDSDDARGAHGFFPF